MPNIKVVVLLVRQLRHGFTKMAKVSPNLTVTHKQMVDLISTVVITTICNVVAHSSSYLYSSSPSPRMHHNFPQTQLASVLPPFMLL